MSNIHHLKTPSTLDQDELRLDQASEWIAKLDRELTRDEQSEFQAWLVQDAKNTQVLVEMAKMWDKMDDLSRLSDLFPKHLFAHQETKPSKTINWLTATAASILVMISLGLYSGFNTFIPSKMQGNSSVIAMQASYQTGVGESNTINLPDNSKLVLNTNSFVQVKYTKTARIIELQRGEIHIDVAHDKSRPLSVLAQGKVIQAVGTAFNVEVRNKLVELLVTDGKVLVAQKSEKQQSVSDDIGAKLPSNSMAIAKGEKIDLGTDNIANEKIVKVDDADIAVSLSWRSGNLIFRGESLAEAMTEISRYTDMTFELSDDEHLKTVQVAGMFKTGDVNGLLEVLNKNFNIDYEKIGNNRIMLKYAG